MYTQLKLINLRFFIAISMLFIVFFLPLQGYWPLVIIPLSGDKIFTLVGLFVVFLNIKNTKFSKTEVKIICLFAIMLLASLLNEQIKGVVFWSFLILISVLVGQAVRHPYGLKFIRSGVLYALYIIFAFGLYQMIYILTKGSFPNELPFKPFVAPFVSENTLMERGGLRMGTAFYRFFLPFGRAQDLAFFAGCFSILYIALSILLNDLKPRKASVILVLSLFIVILTGSRSSQYPFILALSVGVICVFFRAVRTGTVNTKSLIVIITIFLSIIFFLMINYDFLSDIFLQRMVDGDYSGHLGVRGEAFDAFSSLDLYHILLGVGHEQYSFWVGNGIYPHAHMTPLTFLIEYGVIFGFLFFLSLMYWLYSTCSTIADIHCTVKDSYIFYFIKYGAPCFIFLANIFYEFGKAHFFYCFFIILIISTSFQSDKRSL
ncbi:O-antigen ligase family protein [Pseudoalteromonas nigrifaciens]|uniref:O-antigen ligase family protein n=1 Tax=Pseudoalteromonas nigrifaciens TaxID=28109 RepID=UPI0017877CF8|nr:O-antigen ligase family protein [Pseudoalteromonas nigrifaciens]MBE0421905.1 O-antigen ligase family protein [Pseudoalteromonas nigrifaciens]